MVELQRDFNQSLYVLRRNGLLVGWTADGILAQEWAEEEEGRGWAKLFQMVEKPQTQKEKQ